MEMSQAAIDKLTGTQLGILLGDQIFCGQVVRAKRQNNTWLVIDLAWCAKYDRTNDTWNFDPDFRQHAMDMVIFDPKHGASDDGSTFASEVIGESCTFFRPGFTLVDPRKIRIPN